MPPDQYLAAERPTGLRTRLGILTLVLLVSVQFIVIIDTSIVNVTLPSIQRALHFSQQNLQWVLSGYVLTFGGLLLLGGRLAIAEPAATGSAAARPSRAPHAMGDA